MPNRWILLAALLLVAREGAARELPPFALERLQLEPSGMGSLVVGTGRTLEPGVLRVSLQAHYEHLPLNFLREWNPDITGSGVVENKLSGQVSAALGVLPWLQLGAQASYILVERGMDFVDVEAPGGRGLDAPWLSVSAALARMSEGAPVNVAAELAAALPVGQAALLARDRYALMPRLQVGLVDKNYQVGGEVSVLWRPRVDLSPYTGRPHDVMGSELHVAGTVTARGRNRTATRPELSVLIYQPLQGGRTSAEVLIGVRKHVLPSLDLYFLGGPGLGSAVDIPMLRLMVGAAFATGKID